jgi:hypothetical protein
MASGLAPSFLGWVGVDFPRQDFFFHAVASAADPLDRPQHYLGVPLAPVHRRDMPCRQFRSHLPRRHPTAF